MNIFLMAEQAPLSFADLYSRPLFWLVGIGAAVATFVASVMADDQNQRLKNGTFGVAAGSSIGGLAAIFDKSPELLVVGFLGSALGGLVGWLTFLVLSFVVGGTQGGRNWIEYYVNGFKGLRDRLDLQDEQVLLSAIDAWSGNFRRMISDQKQMLAAHDSNDADYFINLIIRGWLVATTDIFALILSTVAKKPEYRSRVTVIIFGSRNGTVAGRHWIHYAGTLQDHKDTEFDQSSIGYKVLTGQVPSPYFTTGQEAKDKGQNRGEQTYRPFYTYKLNHCAILAIDWPESLSSDATKDKFVMRAVELFRSDIVPSISFVLGRRSGTLEQEVGLQPLGQGVDGNPPLQPRESK